MYPYKKQVLFELKQAEKIKRNDEVHFELSGGVNTHHCRIWLLNK